nr:hypothetical protein [Accumulibacter sp.]
MQSFKCQDTQALFAGGSVRRRVGSEHRALCGLSRLDGSSVLDDLRVLPGNRLDAVTGNRRGQHSIRSNDRWGVCLVRTADGLADVAIVDDR